MHLEFLILHYIYSEYVMLMKFPCTLMCTEELAHIIEIVVINFCNCLVSLVRPRPGQIPNSFVKSNSNQILFCEKKSNQIKFLGLWFVLQICFQIICFNKNKTNQIKFVGWCFLFQIFFKFLATTKINQIKSNQISWIMICISNFFQIFVSLL